MTDPQPDPQPGPQPVRMGPWIHITRGSRRYVEGTEGGFSEFIMRVLPSGRWDILDFRTGEQTLASGVGDYETDTAMEMADAAARELGWVLGETP